MVIVVGGATCHQAMTRPLAEQFGAAFSAEAESGA
jgi:hypothetical protein